MDFSTNSSVFQVD